MRPLPCIRHLTALAFLLSSAAILQAQGPAQRIEGVISGEGFSRIKIAVPDLQAAAGAESAALEIVTTLREDLLFSGYFDLLDPTLYGLVPAETPGEPRYEDWLSIGSDALVKTRIQIVDGRIDLQARLYDNKSETLLMGQRYGGSLDVQRRVAHQLADDLVRHYTGKPGVASTRIAFVSKHGDGKEIYLMDYDGRRVRRLTTTSTINLSPAWSPDGNGLAFVSWRGRQPGVYIMSSEGELGHLATVGGELSTAPDWGPKGRLIAYTSDIDGNTEIYLLDRNAGRNTRLTRNPAIDTAPAISPNGREIAFTSDRGGSPQIYVMGTDGLNVRRVSWSGRYNESAAWSPDGGRLAYASRIDGRFEVVVLDLSSESITRLTWGDGNNENPRWSPDGKHLVFASDRAGSYDIYSMRADGDGSVA